MSETQVARPYLEKYCTGCGLDLGCGDDLIVPWAIGIDKRQLGKTNIVGDVSDLQQWFQVSSMDFVFSSHCLEDFTDTCAILKNWLSVLKHSGLLVLFLPDQQKYLEHCAKHNTLPNGDHKHADFSLDYVMLCLNQIGYNNSNVEYYAENLGIYSFALVIRKP